MRHRAASLLVLALAACGGEKAAPWLTYPRCTSCHGDPSRLPASAAAAPPLDVAGNTMTSVRGVGAHQQHLVDGPLRRGMACGECHVVPDDPFHSDGVVAVSFGPLATTLFEPSWNATTLTCATYCHGGTVGGGTLKTPVWTTVNGTQAACGTCHAIPPPAPHLQRNDCGGCHPGYTATAVNPATHVDGVIQVTQNCTSCHGDPAAPAAYAAAPPRDTQGNVATTAPGVGAHRAHVAGGPVRAPLACTECHPATNPATHPEGTLSVTFGPLARGGGAAATWKPATASCATVYCHGATLSGGAVREPVWTQVDGTSSRCGACHGIPPPLPHAQRQDCGSCHPGYTSTTVVAATHVDGIVDATGGETCSSCHGDPTRSGPSQSAPPVDVTGNTATTFRGVGAHQRHLEGGPLRVGIACTECHPVPAAVATGIHPNQVLELAFGPLASTGTTASWDGTSLTCATYCHGATLAGGTLHTPVWTTVDGTQAACGTCHGTPPPKPHIQNTSCGNCHPGSSATSVDPTTHVDGTVQTLTLACTSCHGDASRPLVAGADPRAQAAPPTDTTGAGATSLRSVGAHLAHVNPTAGASAPPTACSECHVVPASTNHADGVVAVTFGTRARTGGVAPAWNGTSCSATYCHGATLSGGLATAPVWTTVNGSQRQCTSCHGNPPSTGRHGESDHRRAGCGGCHAGYTTTSANVAAHIDGAKQVGNKVTAYNASTRTCTNSCHGNKGTW